MPLTVLSGNPTGSFEEMQDSAVKVGNPEIYNTPAPLSLNAGATLTPLQVINGTVVVNNAAATLILAPIRDTAGPTAGVASLLRSFSSRGIIAGDTIYLYIVATLTGAVTLSVAGATGLTFDANTSTTVAAGTGRTLMIRFTSGAPGAETAVIF